MRFILRRALLASAAWAWLMVPALAHDTGWNGKAQAPAYHEDIFPPWQHGANNDAASRGFDFTVPEVDILADFHGDPADPKLVLYVGGEDPRYDLSVAVTLKIVPSLIWTLWP